MKERLHEDTNNSISPMRLILIQTWVNSQTKTYAAVE